MRIKSESRSLKSFAIIIPKFYRFFSRKKDGQSGDRSRKGKAGEAGGEDYGGMSLNVPPPQVRVSNVRIEIYWVFIFNHEFLVRFEINGPGSRHAEATVNDANWKWRGW